MTHERRALPLAVGPSSDAPEEPPPSYEADLARKFLLTGC